MTVAYKRGDNSAQTLVKRSRSKRGARSQLHWHSHEPPRRAACIKPRIGGVDMPNVQLKSRSVPLAASISLVLLASQVAAQEGPREEVIVTGSYIKRDTFDAPSPTEVIDGAAIQESGAPSMGMFIRD